ncbi:cell surface glycoprotein (s-layer protein)-like protein [Anaeramoeba flamelloides]|uniref:Cell surface glycoprotein (S-layer protein)-like protein n=1 Tax=Anaeramoeba flamelloides TaxID=1746091 RepID=A0ABQ8XKM1_9EUKA|nr:cell surface glycoprotein (s-layer protein)-like protein [Anaeramoeba flamelloides]
MDLTKKKNINSGKCKKELIFYEKNIEKFLKNRNDLKANLKIVEYKNVLCGVDQFFEINKETNNMKSNFNFTNFRQIKNLVINYEHPIGLEPRINQTTHSLIFTSKSNKDLTYLQESQPLIINSQHRTCKGQYNVLQNGNNHVSIEYQIPESFLSDPKTKNQKQNTYIGGVDYEKGTVTRYDQNGNIYLLGLTKSSDFPIVGSNVYNPNYSSESDYDAVIIKAKDGTDLFWSTFICKVGWYFNYYNGLSVDPSDNQAIISGTTEFPKHYPTTSNAWQNNSKNCAQNCPYGYSGFVSKINENGTELVFSTLICGYADGCVYVSSHEIIYDHEEETNYGDNYSIYFVGATNGTQFPGYGLTNDGFKYTSKNFGYDYIFGKISNDGSQLLQTQCLGGTKNELPWGHGLKVDKDYLVFQFHTYSMNFPVTNGAFQQERSTNSYMCVVGKLNITTFELNWASYLGGNKSDYASTIRMYSNQDIWVGGSTRSLDFPVTLDAYRTEGIATNDTNDSFLTKLSKDGERLLYSTFLGTSPTDSTKYPNVEELRIDKNNDQILLIGGAGLVSDHINIPSDLNYGNGSFLLYFNYTNNEFLKAYSYGGIINSLDTFNNRIENFAITGEIRYYALRTTDDAFQKERPGYYDVIFSGNMYGCPKGYYSEDEQFGKCYSCPQEHLTQRSIKYQKIIAQNASVAFIMINMGRLNVKNVPREHFRHKWVSHNVKNAPWAHINPMKNL